jgi:hypothetical protein
MTFTWLSLLAEVAWLSEHPVSTGRRLAADPHGQLDGTAADGLIDVATNNRRVCAREGAMQVRERLTVQQRNSACKGARFQRLAEYAPPLVAAADAEFDLDRAADARQYSGLHFVLARELDQATDQFIARLEGQDESEICAGKRHGASAVVVARR